MEIRPIRNDADHRMALQEIERLWDFPDDSPENDRLDVLATLVAACEKTRWPIDDALGAAAKKLKEQIGKKTLH